MPGMQLFRGKFHSLRALGIAHPPVFQSWNYFPPPVDAWKQSPPLGEFFSFRNWKSGGWRRRWGKFLLLPGVWRMRSNICRYDTTWNCVGISRIGAFVCLTIQGWNVLRCWVFSGIGVVCSRRLPEDFLWGSGDWIISLLCKFQVAVRCGCSLTIIKFPNSNIPFHKSCNVHVAK